MAYSTGSTPSGQFNTTEPGQNPTGPGVSPVPGPMPIPQQEAPTINNMQSSSSKKSGGGILGAIGGIAGSIFGGPIGGSIGSAVGSGIGSMFSEGGPVRYNQGGMGMNPDGTYGSGQTLEPGPAPQPSMPSSGNPQNGMNEAIGLGYIIGALHQQDFGGTPETLQQAAEQIKQMMAGNPEMSMGMGNPEMSMGMAEGGAVQSETGNADQAYNALMQALGYGGAGTNVGLNDQPSGQTQPTMTGSMEPLKFQGGGVTPYPGVANMPGMQPSLPPARPMPGSPPVASQPAQRPSGGVSTMPGQMPPQGSPNATNGMMAPMPSQGMPNGVSASMPGSMQSSAGMMQRLPNPNATVASGNPGNMAGMARGFMQNRGFAQGGTAQELSPGQTFTGEGSVEGPGGPTSDSIPARLSDGEFVMSAAATQFFGVDKLAKMNEQGKQGFMQATQQVMDNQSMPPSQGSPTGGMRSIMSGFMSPKQNTAGMDRSMPSSSAANRPKSSGFMGQ